MTRKINNSYELGQSNAPTDGGDMLKTRADGTLVWEGVDDTTFVPSQYAAGDRGVFSGLGASESARTNIDYITISSSGNATDFGDLGLARSTSASCSNISRGLIGGGYATSTRTDTIEYITIATPGSALDFGDLTLGRDYIGSCSNITRGIFASGGFNPYSSSNITDIIDYVTIDTTGDATDFGNLTAVWYQASGLCDGDRGVFAGGGIAGGNAINYIDYFTIATTGNALDFGDLLENSENNAACSDTARGLIGAGSGTSNRIQYITIATTGNSIDFGDLTVGRTQLASCSDGTLGLWAGGYSSNVIDYVTISSLGNAADFGDLTQTSNGISGCSGD